MHDVKLRLLIGTVAAVATVAVACGGHADSTPTSTPSAVAPTVTAVSATPSPSPTQTVEQAVLEAYRRYWEVYANAVFTLDGSKLNEVMTGPRLQRALDEIASLQARGQAVQIVVENQPVVVAVNGDEAGVVDHYKNGSYAIHAKTKQPLSATPTPNELQDTFTLVRENGVWKVRDTVRQASPP